MCGFVSKAQTWTAKFAFSPVLKILFAEPRTETSSDLCAPSDASHIPRCSPLVSFSSAPSLSLRARKHVESSISGSAGSEPPQHVVPASSLLFQPALSGRCASTWKLVSRLGLCVLKPPDKTCENVFPSCGPDSPIAS